MLLDKDRWASQAYSHPGEKAIQERVRRRVPAIRLDTVCGSSGSSHDWGSPPRARDSTRTRGHTPISCAGSGGTSATCLAGNRKAMRRPRQLRNSARCGMSIAGWSECAMPASPSAGGSEHDHGARLRSSALMRRKRECPAVQEGLAAPAFGWGQGDAARTRGAVRRRGPSSFRRAGRYSLTTTRFLPPVLAWYMAASAFSRSS